MKDRAALHPGRVKLTPVSGETNLYDMERADEPTQEGTPLNKATLLTDETAAILNLGEDPTVDEAIRAVAVGVVSSILVFAPTGSTVTATKGSVVKTATEQNGEWLFFTSPGTWTVRATLNGMSESQTIEVTEVKQYKVVLEYAKIYGAEWDGTSSPAWSRTDGAAGFRNPVPYVGVGGNGSSPFDNCYPWSEMETVIDDTLVSKGYDGQMVKIPKFYYKWTRTGDKMKLQIADRNPEWLSGFHVSPAHADRGDGKGERDFVYVGKHKITLPYNSGMRQDARTIAHSVGDAYWLFDFAMYWTIAMLYLVEFAHWNSQMKIGRGCSYGTDALELDKTSIYHTGTNAAARSEYHYYTKYRDIVGLWSNRYEWVDGIRFEKANIYCYNNPAKYQDVYNDLFSDSDPGTLVGTRTTEANAYISKWTNPTAPGFEYALFPAEAAGAESTYICDKEVYDKNGQVLYIGGAGDSNQDGYVTRGLFWLNGGNQFGWESYNYKLFMRVIKLP